jgi:glycyl-tRNA synthetase beta chain
LQADGTPTPAAIGFASRQGVDVAALERVETAKGVYLAYRKRQRGKATVDVLPDVLAGLLRGLSFPKMMRWDAVLGGDGRGDLPFGRPIRWMLFLYGGRVVPFTISRSAAAQTGQVQDVTTGAVTYGHRFLTTSGRAGRAIKVRTFEEYRQRLLENFVILERGERHDKIARELDAKAQRLKGRVSRAVRAESGLLQEVPDLVEYPSVIAGTFAPEFLDLPEEVLTTTLVHHQHYFPLEDEGGRLMPAFLAVINTEPDNERTIARNAERVVTARLRDARFFWEADRKTPLESRIGRLSTLLFHKKLGSYRDKGERIEQLAAWIAREAFGEGEAVAAQAAQAARLAKADLTTDMVREFTELQGTMGGIYARLEGRCEEIWKAMYFQYLPVGIDADAAPSRAELGKAAVTWAAVSLADKLDTIVGLFAAGEKPTGSRDPYGLRRAAHGVFKTLVDLPELTGSTARPLLGQLLGRADAPFGSFVGQAPVALYSFLAERLAFVLEQRGFDIRNVRAVTHGGIGDLSPSDVRRRLEALTEFTESAEFQQLAVAFKRVRNIAKELPLERFQHLEAAASPLQSRLTEPAERALLEEIERRRPVIEAVLARGDGYREAFAEASRVGPSVDRFFTDVLVMAPDAGVREARLQLLRRLEALILKVADISEIVPEER